MLGPDDKVESRSIKVSRTVGDQWLVDEGLAAGERVIVEGVQKVKPGMSAKGVAPSPRTDIAGRPLPRQPN